MADLLIVPGLFLLRMVGRDAILLQKWLSNVKLDSNHNWTDNKQLYLRLKNRGREIKILRVQLHVHSNSKNTISDLRDFSSKNGLGTGHTLQINLPIHLLFPEAQLPDSAHITLEAEGYPNRPFKRYIDPKVLSSIFPNYQSYHTEQLRIQENKRQDALFDKTSKPLNLQPRGRFKGGSGTFPYNR